MFNCMQWLASSGKARGVCGARGGEQQAQQVEAEVEQVDRRRQLRHGAVLHLQLVANVTQFYGSIVK